jgi:tetratricopeptide (TPR) repeat protein
MAVKRACLPVCIFFASLAAAPSIAVPVDSMKSPSPQRVNRILNDTAGILWEFTDDYFHNGDYAQAIQLDRVINRLDPHLEEAYSVAAWLGWSSGHTSAAIAQLELGIRNNPNDYLLYSDTGDFYWLWLKQPAKALPYYIRATSFYAECPWSVFGSLAHAAEKEGDYGRAAIAWKTARLKAATQQELTPIESNLTRVLAQIDAIRGGHSRPGAASPAETNRPGLVR